MIHLGVDLLNNVVASSSYLETEIHVVIVNGQTLIEPSDFVKYRLFGKKTGGRHRTNLVWKNHALVIARLPIRQKKADMRGAERPAHRNARMLHKAIWIQQLCSNAAHFIPQRRAHHELN